MTREKVAAAVAEVDPDGNGLERVRQAALRGIRGEPNPLCWGSYNCLNYHAGGGPGKVDVAPFGSIVRHDGTEVRTSTAAQEVEEWFSREICAYAGHNAGETIGRKYLAFMGEEVPA